MLNYICTDIRHGNHEKGERRFESRKATHFRIQCLSVSHLKALKLKCTKIEFYPLFCMDLKSVLSNRRLKLFGNEVLGGYLGPRWEMYQVEGENFVT
jgi:hypothetical protein